MSQGTTGGPASGAGLHDAIWGTLGTEGHPTLEELTMAEQSVEVVKGIYAAFATGDVPGVLGAFSEDIEWYEAEGMPYGGLHRGGDAVAQKVFGPIAEDVDNFAVTPEEFMASGESVAVITRYTGTGKETGRDLDQTAVHVWNIRDGKAARFRQFMDTVKFAEVVPLDVSVAR